LWQGMDTTGILSLICGCHWKIEVYLSFPPTLELSPADVYYRTYATNVCAKFEGEWRIIVWRRGVIVTAFFAWALRIAAPGRQHPSVMGWSVPIFPCLKSLLTRGLNQFLLSLLPFSCIPALGCIHTPIFYTLLYLAIWWGASYPSEVPHEDQGCWRWPRTEVRTNSSIKIY